MGKCTNPILRTRKEKGFTSNGKYTLKYAIEVRCGKCIACRIYRAECWTNRMLDELITQKNKAGFITLTYNEQTYTMLNKEDIQKFMKRLRFNTQKKIKYYLCGEYGDQTLRPHYHCIIFGLDYLEFMPYYNHLTQKYHSKLAEENWKMGNCIIEKVTPATIRYVANYICIKPDFEKLVNIPKPFSLMSKSIGKEYAIQNKEIIFRDNYTRNGKPVPISRTYNKWCKINKKKPELQTIMLDTWDEWRKMKILYKKKNWNDESFKNYQLAGMSANNEGKAAAKKAARGDTKI